MRSISELQHDLSKLGKPVDAIIEKVAKVNNEAANKCLPGKFNEAIALLEAALLDAKKISAKESREKLTSILLSNLGYTYAKNEKFSVSAEYFTKALEFNKNSPFLLDQRGLAFLLANDPLSAQADFLSALELARKNKEFAGLIPKIGEKLGRANEDVSKMPPLKPAYVAPTLKGFIPPLQTPAVTKFTGTPEITDIFVKQSSVDLDDLLAAAKLTVESLTVTRKRKSEEEQGGNKVKNAKAESFAQREVQKKAHVQSGSYFGHN
jgi:tetratricopeptide (TPR) repeat protein